MREFLAIATAHFLALLSPGQDFFLLVRASVRHGTKAGLACAAGIALANGMWIALTLAGLELIRDFGPVMTVLRLFGGGLLIWLGWGFLTAQHSPQPLAAETAPRPAFWMGCLSGLGNPKNGIFYTGLFSFVVAPTTSLDIRALYGVWMVGAVLAWDAVISLWLGHPRQQQWLGRWQGRIEQGAGAILIILGVGMTLRG